MSDELEREVARSVGRFAERELDPRRASLERYPDGAWPTEILAGLDELGLLEPGALADPALQRAAMETLGAHSVAVAVILFAHCLGERLAPAPRDGLRASPCYGEPLDHEPGLRATLEGDGVRLRGRVEMVVNAPIARQLVLPCSLEGTLALVVVPADARGLSIGDPILTLGARGCPVADVEADCVLPGSAIVEGDARAAIESAYRAQRGPALAIGAGVLGASLETATAYARERHQGGHPIIEHTQIRAMLSNMAARAALLREASHRVPCSDGLFLAAKEGLDASDGVQILGGYGYMTDYPQEGRMRDVRQLRCLLGRPDALRQRMAERPGSIEA